MTDDSRFQSLELQIKTLRDDFSEVKTALKELAKDMHALALSAAARDTDRAAVERVFRTLDEVKENTDKQFVGTDSAIDKLNLQLKALDDFVQLNERMRIQQALIDSNEEIKRLQKESNKWMWETVKAAIVVIIAVVLAKFGIKG